MNGAYNLVSAVTVISTVSPGVVAPFTAAWIVQ